MNVFDGDGMEIPDDVQDFPFQRPEGHLFWAIIGETWHNDRTKLIFFILAHWVNQCFVLNNYFRCDRGPAIGCVSKMSSVLTFGLANSLITI